MKKIYTLFLVLISLCFNQLFSQITYTYTGKPMFNILAKRSGTVIGNIVVELYPKVAPYHTRNFDSLVSKQFYDTTAFHRVVPGFVIQGGDPNSRQGPINTWGFGQPGQPTVKAEFTKAKHLRGVLSAARSSNPNSATSQFFICVATAANLDGNYSVYGRVLSGMSFVDNIVTSPITAPAPSSFSQMPLQKIEMFVTYIGSNDSVPNAPVLTAPSTGTTNIDTLAFLPFRWNRVNDAVLYSLEMAYDSLFVMPDTTIEVGTNLYSLNGKFLDPNTKYFWRVRTNNGGKYSNYSTVWSFTTVGPEIPNLVGLKRNNLDFVNVRVFPNPSSGKFLFEGLLKGNMIKINNAEGKLIREILVENEKIEIDLSTQAKGIYFYTIKNSSGHTTEGKLILK
jgi:peptidyl-prolyl cis-trans isomerase B (cyclophilin B)